MLPSVMTAAAVFSVLVSDFEAQLSRPPGALAILTESVEVTDAARLYEPSLGFRFYGVPQEFEITVGIFNESSAAILIPLQDFTSHITVTLDPGGPLDVRWIPPAVSGDFAGPAGELRVPAGPVSRYFRGIVRSASSPFSPGRHLLHVGLTGALATIVSESAERLVPLRTDVTMSLTMLEPQSASERTVALEFLGGVALGHQDYENAERLFTLARDSDPEKLKGVAGLGLVYLHLKRYRNAAECFERLPQGGHNAVPQLLAQAYVGMGDEAAATRVLQQAGFSNARLAEELARIRQTIANR